MNSQNLIDGAKRKTRKPRRSRNASLNKIMKTLRTISKKSRFLIIAIVLPE